jgi:N-acetylglucosamine kinase-like BadF-type ATPase
MTDDVLGIEGGGTKTTWARVARDGTVRAHRAAGAGNTLLLDDAALKQLLESIAAAAGHDVAAIGAAFAGCARLEEQHRVERAIRAAWPDVGPVRVIADREGGRLGASLCRPRQRLRHRAPGDGGGLRALGR